MKKLQPRKMTILLATALFLLALTLAACGDEVPMPTETPTSMVDVLDAASPADQDSDNATTTVSAMAEATPAPTTTTAATPTPSATPVPAAATLSVTGNPFATLEEKAKPEPETDQTAYASAATLTALNERIESLRQDFVAQNAENEQAYAEWRQMAREWTAELLNWKNLEEGSAGKPASNPENDPEVIALREELANQAHELERQNREGDLALLKAETELSRAINDVYNQAQAQVARMLEAALAKERAELAEATKNLEAREDELQRRIGFFNSFQSAHLPSCQRSIKRAIEDLERLERQTIDIPRTTDEARQKKFLLITGRVGTDCQAAADARTPQPFTPQR